MSYVFQAYPQYVRSPDGKKKAIVHNEAERDAKLAEWVPARDPDQVVYQPGPVVIIARPLTEGEPFNGADPAGYSGIDGADLAKYRDGDGKPGGSLPRNELVEPSEPEEPEAA